MDHRVSSKGGGYLCNISCGINSRETCSHLLINNYPCINCNSGASGERDVGSNAGTDDYKICQQGFSISEMECQFSVTGAFYFIRNSIQSKVDTCFLLSELSEGRLYDHPGP